MKKKFLFLSALAAATTAFISCSSDENLAEVPEVIEEPTATPEDEGTPLVVKLVDGNGTTRATKWTAETLPSFTLYSVKNGGTERWDGLCSYSDAGVSTGSLFTNQEDAENPGTLTGEFTNANGIKWKDGNWDFYALSDPTFTQESNGKEGEEAGQQDAEHLDAASDRNFTYTVSNTYGDQKDLLVAAVANKTKATPTISLPFYHALARIKSVKLNFKPVGEDNEGWAYIIKSMTLKNIPSTATFTFPNPDADAIDKDNIHDCWGTATVLKDYALTFPDFERDVNGNIKIFEETQDDGGDVTENDATAYAIGTKRGGIDGLPNYLRFPETEATYEFPIANDGTTDDGLYLIPQTLEKTKLQIEDGGTVTYYHFNTDGTNNYNTPYLEVKIVRIVDADWGGDFDTSNITGDLGASDDVTGAANGSTKMTNAFITKAIDIDDTVTVSIPLSSITLKANKYYSLNFYFNMAVNTDDDDTMIFDGAGLE